MIKLYYEGIHTNSDRINFHMVRVIEPTKSFITVFSVKNYADGIVDVDVSTEFLIKPTINTLIECFDKNSNFLEIIKKIYPEEKNIEIKEIRFVFNGVELSINEKTLEAGTIIKQYLKKCFVRKRK